MAKKKKKKNSGQVSRNNADLKSWKLLKFRTDSTKVRVNNLYGNTSMNVVDRKDDWTISYVMTTHAIERMNERAMYETDIRNTLAFGASFRRYQEERDTYVYVYEYKCFRVVVDREVTTDMEDVVVITATYSYAFNDFVRRFESIVYASDWRLHRGLRLVYDELGSAAFEERSTERVKNLMLKRGYVLHNDYTLSLIEKRKNFDFEVELGSQFRDYMDTVARFNQAYGEHREEIESGDYDSFCASVGDGYTRVDVHGRDYIVRPCDIGGKVLPVSKIKEILGELREYVFLTDHVYVLACGHRYNVTLGYCGRMMFVYAVEELTRYLEEVDRYTVYSMDPESFRHACGSYLNERGFSIYDPRFTPAYQKELANMGRLKNLKTINTMIKAQNESNVNELIG